MYIISIDNYSINNSDNANTNSSSRSDSIAAYIQPNNNAHIFINCTTALHVTHYYPPASSWAGYEDGVEAMDAGERERAIAELCAYVGRCQQHALLPLKEVHSAMEALRLLVATRGTCAVVRQE